MLADLPVRNVHLTSMDERVYNINMKKISLYLPEQQINALHMLCKDSGIPVSEHIRRAISEYLNALGRARINAYGDGNITAERQWPSQKQEGSSR